MEEGIPLEIGAKRLAAGDQDKERKILQALRAAKIAAYNEMLIAANFHAGPHGQGINGLIAGMHRAIQAAEAEAYG